MPLPGFFSRWRTPFATALALLLAVGVFAGTEWTYQRALESLVNLGGRGVARTAAQNVVRSLLDLESAQRGYLLTGRAQYLAPYRTAANELDIAIRRLREHYRSDPELLQLVEDLHERALQKVSEAAETITLYDAGSHQSWQGLLLTDIGREKMESVRRAADVLLVTEERRIAAERVAIYRTLAIGRFTVHGLALLSLLACVFFWRKNTAFRANLAAHAGQLQAERDSLERQVALRTTALRNLAGHHVNAREDERGRVARELHDEMGGLLTAMKLELARLRRVPEVPPLALERVAGVEQRLNEGIAVKRRIVENLRPSSLDQLGLIPALEVLCQDVAAGLGVPVHTDFSPVALDKNAELTVYRLVQESLTNVSKYARARQVRVRLAAVGDRVQVSVHDDGQGFDTEAVPAGHHGLLGMRVRVESHAGRLDVRSAPGQGTRVDAELPAARATGDAAA
jgi:signal transduction histidine kinase